MQWQLNLRNGSLYAENLSNFNTVSLHIDPTDYTIVQPFFCVFFSILSLTTFVPYQFSLSLSLLCASDLHFLSVSELCAMPVFSPLHSYSNAVCQGDGLLGGESVQQWRCVDVKLLESQALPAKLQKGTDHFTEQLNPL